MSDAFPNSILQYTESPKKCAAKKCPCKEKSITFLIDSEHWHLDCYIKEKTGQDLEKDS